MKKRSEDRREEGDSGKRAEEEAFSEGQPTHSRAPRENEDGGESGTTELLSECSSSPTSVLREFPGKAEECTRASSQSLSPRRQNALLAVAEKHRRVLVRCDDDVEKTNTAEATEVKSVETISDSGVAGAKTIRENNNSATRDLFLRCHPNQQTSVEKDETQNPDNEEILDDEEEEEFVPEPPKFLPTSSAQQKSVNRSASETAESGGFFHSLRIGSGRRTSDPHNNSKHLRFHPRRQSETGLFHTARRASLKRTLVVPSSALVSMLRAQPSSPTAHAHAAAGEPASNKSSTSSSDSPSKGQVEAQEEDDLRDYISSARQAGRRATDFSQADNDLRRFLALREAQRRDSDQDLPSPPPVFSAR